MSQARWLIDEARWPEELFRALWSQPFSPAPQPRGANVFPPVNIYDDGESFLVRAEIPGVNKDSLDIAVKGDELHLRGERQTQAAQSSAAYHRREVEGGQFRRVVTLPQRVDPERIQATFKNGVLEVVLPRVPEAKERKITIH